MKKASYRQAIAWIATEDDPGSDDALDPEQVSFMLTSCLVADIFETPREQVGNDVVEYRKKHHADWYTDRE